jgi:fumarate hydratase subunit alpha
VKRRVAKLSSLLVIVAIVVLSLLPSKEVSALVTPLPFADKGAHFIAYAVASWLLILAFGRERTLFVFIVTSLLGLLIEVIQPHFGRTFDPLDLVVNCVGALFGVFLGRVYLKYEEKKMGKSKQRGLVDKIRQTLLEAAVHLEEGLMERLEWMHREMNQELATLDPQKSASYKASIEVLEMINENLKLSEEHKIPMCQDSGMIVAFVEIGTEVPLSMQAIEEAINEGSELAIKEGFFRNSVVEEPVFERVNTKTNLPPIIYWNPSKERHLKISFLLKGFGSENCSGLAMLNPTSGPEGVVEAVAEMVQRAGGKPCPPIVVGVGLGGTAERAGYLSKKALLRPVNSVHPEERYAQLEQDILAAIQGLEIGPGGFGGPLTALGVAVEYEPTHIAGLPVAASISCWADRKGEFVWEGPYA